MISQHQDLLLWTFLGVFGFFAARAVQRQLYAIRAISEVTQDSPQQEVPARRTENGLKLSTLAQLSQSPNPDISAASVRIITDLALEKLPLELMLRNIKGGNEERRNRALTCLCFLKLNLVKLQPHIRETYNAIIDCLCNLLPEANETETMLHEKKYAIRSQHSLDALSFLHRVLPYEFKEAVNAGLVTRWLKQYPFGGFTSKEKRRERIKKLLISEYEDMHMYDIMSIAVARDQSRHQLEDYGLFDKTGLEEAESETLGNGSRFREESAEEIALRRRRREAMVIGENGMPLRRANIIEQNFNGDEGSRRFEAALRASLRASMVQRPSLQR